MATVTCEIDNKMCGTGVTYSIYYFLGFVYLLTEIYVEKIYLNVILSPTKTYNEFLLNSISYCCYLLIEIKVIN